MVVALGWHVESGEISALYGNSQNKLLSVLGPLCRLHQHLAPALAQHVSAPHVFKKQPLLQWEKCHRCPWLGTDLGAWQQGGRQGGGGTEIPARALLVPPSWLPQPRHLLPFDLLI